MGVPDLYDRIADETVGTTEEEILPSGSFDPVPTAARK
jgi:hypothetical protein